MSTLATHAAVGEPSSHADSVHRSTNGPLLAAIALSITGYFVAVACGVPLDVSSGAHGQGHDASHPPYWMVTPFLLLLGAIAVFPLLPAVEHWWERNRNRFAVAAGLGLLTLLYYWLSGGFAKAEGILLHAVLMEYLPFITLLFALYTISGGIRITCDLKAHPAVNTGFIAVGGLLASFIGTTGAAMLLIRPLIATNRQRKHVQHTVIFFVFVVCNCGGCLLPIGDPPLFLGYLMGVNFFWTLSLWPQWLFVNVLLIGMYFLWDHFFCYRRESSTDLQQDETQTRPLKIEGWKLNVPLLIGVVFSVALLAPGKPIPGLGWSAWPFLREIVQLGLVGLSLLFGCGKLRRANQFNYHAILEVAALFFGIFLCMQPALEILEAKGQSLGIESEASFFWMTGGLSAVLDNAPTYVVFFKTAHTLSPGEQFAATGGVAPNLLGAISLGAVFLGAMTYIGNGPNFMVKAIAEKSGVPMPSFIGYVFRYSLPVLLPVFLLTAWLFM